MVQVLLLCMVLPKSLCMKFFGRVWNILQVLLACFRVELECAVEIAYAQGDRYALVALLYAVTD